MEQKKLTKAILKQNEQLLFIADRPIYNKEGIFRLLMKIGKFGCSSQWG